MAAPIIVFHTAWMDKYDGDRESLNAGGFTFALEHGYGHEMYNFRAVDGRCYGYVPPTGELHFERHFAVDRKSDRLEGATVVWTAPHPEKGGRAVVGIWLNATVFREDQTPSGRLARQRNIDGDVAGYRCVAESKNCILIPTEPDARPIFVRARQPRGEESWPGQQKVFYPKSNSTALRRLNEIIGNFAFPNSSDANHERKATKSRRRRTRWQVDIEKRHKIEIAAIKAVWDRLEEAKYVVKSVEKENRGYDLLAVRDGEILHVEVKGRSGSDIAADLSVNEFGALGQYQRQRSPSAHYRIAIVTNALHAPCVNEFVLVKSGAAAHWTTLDGRCHLTFVPRTAAQVKGNSAPS